MRHKLQLLVKTIQNLWAGLSEMRREFVFIVLLFLLVCLEIPTAARGESFVRSCMFLQNLLPAVSVCLFYWTVGFLQNVQICASHFNPTASWAFFINVDLIWLQMLSQPICILGGESFCFSLSVALDAQSHFLSWAKPKSILKGKFPFQGSCLKKLNKMHFFYDLSLLSYFPEENFPTLSTCWQIRPWQRQTNAELFF